MTAPHLLLLLSLLTLPAGVSAQTAAAWVPRAAPSALLDPEVRGPLRANWNPEPQDSLPRIRPTYWQEGALIGGLAGGIGLAVLAGGLCAYSDDYGKDCTGTTLLGGVIGAGLGGIPGALIGGLFPKHPKNVKVGPPSP